MILVDAIKVVYHNQPALCHPSYNPGKWHIAASIFRSALRPFSMMGNTSMRGAFQWRAKLTSGSSGFTRNTATLAPLSAKLRAVHSVVQRTVDTLSLLRSQARPPSRAHRPRCPSLLQVPLLPFSKHHVDCPEPHCLPSACPQTGGYSAWRALRMQDTWGIYHSEKQMCHLRHLNHLRHLHRPWWA